VHSPCRIFLIDSHFLSLRIVCFPSSLEDAGFRPLASIRPCYGLTVRGREAEYTSGRRGVAQVLRRNLSGAWVVRGFRFLRRRILLHRPGVNLASPHPACAAARSWFSRNSRARISSSVSRHGVGHAQQAAQVDEVGLRRGALLQFNPAPLLDKFLRCHPAPESVQPSLGVPAANVKLGSRPAALSRVHVSAAIRDQSGVVPWPDLKEFLYALIYKDYFFTTRRHTNKYTNKCSGHTGFLGLHCPRFQSKTATTLALRSLLSRKAGSGAGGHCRIGGARLDFAHPAGTRPHRTGGRRV